METIRLFDEDSKLIQFEAVVLSCEEDGDLYKITLNQTAFFPEEGGQTCDQGTLNDIQVEKVLEKNRIVYHWLKEPIWEGDTVTGYIDWTKRFSDMQQHSGEHIVSGLVHEQFGYDNVGFHLGSEFVTMDFNGMITEEQIRKIEVRANEAVIRDLKIEVTYPTKDELAEMDYRSKKVLEGQVRIVTIPGVDVCACCAPHVYTTGEIGMIKIINLEKYKGGVRVYMLCGFRALADFNEKQESVQNISKLLSAKPNEVYEAVVKQNNEVQNLKMALGNLKLALIEEKIRQLPDTENVCLFDENIQKTNSKKVLSLLTSQHSGVCGCFAGDDEKGYAICIGSRTADVKATGQALIKALNGRGGGNKEMFQGSVKALRSDIEAYFRQL